MKNIHILPTDKARLYIHQGKLYDHKTTMHIAEGTQIPQNIYITSNGEIKEGFNQWYLDRVLNKPYNSGGAQYAEKQDIIILTTDQDLIKEGVQAIDDEFLEWFINNPSCEEVEVERDSREVGGHNGGVQIEYGLYEIIIPKEEQKQHLIDMMRYDEELGLYEEPKQYTFKEVKPKDIQRIIASTNAQTASIEILQLFSQYQAKIMYSDEEVFNLCRAFATFVAHNDPSYKKQQEWFEQFKKK